MAERENLEELVKKSEGKSKEEVSLLVQTETAPLVRKKQKESIRVVKCQAPKEAPLLSEEVSSAGGCPKTGR